MRGVAFLLQIIGFAFYQPAPLLGTAEQEQQQQPGAQPTDALPGGVGELPAVTGAEDEMAVASECVGLLRGLFSEYNLSWQWREALNATIVMARGPPRLQPTRLRHCCPAHLRPPSHPLPNCLRARSAAPERHDLACP